MLTDDFLRSLPDDPELAFIQLVDRLDEWLSTRPPDDPSGDPYLPRNYTWERKYADTLRAFVDEYDLDVPFRSYGRHNFEGDNGGSGSQTM
jgi:hypothetical protein